MIYSYCRTDQFCRLYTGLLVRSTERFSKWAALGSRSSGQPTDHEPNLTRPQDDQAQNSKSLVYMRQRNGKFFGMFVNPRISCEFSEFSWTKK